MKCLTQMQASAWLRSHGQMEDPYLGHQSPPYKVICAAPESYPAIECFANVIFTQIITEGDVLFYMTDWEPTEQCRDFVFAALRHAVGEIRPQAKAPAYLINDNEKYIAIALFCLAACFKWKCYAYGSHDQITLYNWEGDVFDFWTSSKSKKEDFEKVRTNFRLKRLKPN